MIYAERGSASWWKFVLAHKDKLLSLVLNYHPSRGMCSSENITAPRAEAMRQLIVAKMEKSTGGDFSDALRRKDAGAVYRILNQAWFGVPESTDCWAITGFKEACTILDEEVPNE